MKKKIACLFFAFMLLFSVFPLSIFADETANGDANDPLQSMDLSKTTIDYDFQNVFLGEYDINNYKPNASMSDIELITFTEVKNNSGQIELYLYLYNPSQKTIFDNETNKISFAYYEGDGQFENFEKYQIARVASEYSSKNTSTETNASIIKYKVVDYARVTDSDSRSYGISEVEINLKGVLKSYPLGKSFNYVDSSDGMLLVSHGSFDVLELKANHTFYRVQSDGTGKYKDIRTVYFAVENNLISNYGDLYDIKCSWQEYKTKPILLIDDKDIYNDFKAIEGKTIPDDFRYSFGSGITSAYAIISSIPPIVAVQSVGNYGTEFNYAINPEQIPSRFLRGERGFFENFQLLLFPNYLYRTYGDMDHTLYQTELEKLYWVFYCETGDDIVSGEELLEHVSEYSGGQGMEWSQELFSSILLPQTVTFDVIQNKELEEYEINSRAFEWTKRWFKNKDVIVNDTFDFNLLQKFDTKDYSLEDEELCEKYLIDFNDVKDFRSFLRDNANSSIYLLRYEITDTTVEEGSLFDGEEFQWENILPVFLGMTGESYACTSSLVETSLISDFDIIEVSLKKDDGVFTAFPVGISPTDHAPDIGQLPEPDPDSPAGEYEEFMNKLEMIIKIIVIIAVIALALYVLFVISPYITPFLSRLSGSGKTEVQSNVNINLSEETNKKKDEVKKDEKKTN